MSRHTHVRRKQSRLTEQTEETIWISGLCLAMALGFLAMIYRVSPWIDEHIYHWVTTK